MFVEYEAGWTEELVATDNKKEKEEWVKECNCALISKCLNWLWCALGLLFGENGALYFGFRVA
jgi:hypothetical protein